MKNTLKISVMCVATVSVLGGCATSQPALQGKLDPHLGSAVKANVSVHFVEPSAAQKANTFIPADPTRTSKARQNYRENKIAEPTETSTQND